MVIKKTAKGFSLIELMIVIAIIGILASIAVPSYRVYIVKARLTEVIVFANSLKTTVTEQVATTGNTLTSNCGAISVPDMKSDKVVGSFFHGSGCYIEVMGNPTALGMDSSVGSYISIFLKPILLSDGSLNWKCGLWSPNGPNAVGQYAPATCPAVQAGF